MQLFYTTKILDDQLLLTEEEHRHVSKVLRKKIGDILNVTDGKGTLFRASIICFEKINTRLEIISKHISPASKYNLRIAIAPTKMASRFEWFLEKATEIGINEIIPIISNHSERSKLNIERSKKIILSAMKQAQRCYLPEIRPLIKYSDFIKQKNTPQSFIAYVDFNQKNSLKELCKSRLSTTVLIGPEGGFSANELLEAASNNFTPVSLGDFRYRTETAGIIACHTVNLKNQS